MLKSCCKNVQYVADKKFPVTPLTKSEVINGTRKQCHHLLHKITVLETDLTIDSYLTAFLE